LTVSQDDGSLHLAVGDGPIFFEQAVLFFGRNQAETALFIEPDRPSGGSPCSDQQGTVGLGFQVREELPPDSSILFGGSHVSMADEGDVLDLLQAHHSHQTAFLLITPKENASGDLVPEIFRGHVGFLPAIRRNHPPVRSGSVIDDFANRWKIIRATRPDHIVFPVSVPFSRGRSEL